MLTPRQTIAGRGGSPRRLPTPYASTRVSRAPGDPARPTSQAPEGPGESSVSTDRRPPRHTPEVERQAAQAPPVWSGVRAMRTSAWASADCPKSSERLHTEVIRLAEKRLAPIANARRQLDDEPPMVEPLKVARQWGEHGGVRLDDDPHVPRRHVGRLVLCQRRSRPAEDEDGRPQNEEPSDEPSHQTNRAISGAPRLQDGSSKARCPASQSKRHHL